MLSPGGARRCTARADRSSRSSLEKRRMVSGTHLSEFFRCGITMNHETAIANAKEIAGSVLAPAARQNDKEARFSTEAVKALGAAGLLGMMLPAEVGGSGLGPR